MIAPDRVTVTGVTCDWAVDETCLPDLPAEGDPVYAAAVAQHTGALELAIQVMWALSGRQFGICPATVRPCLQTLDSIWNPRNQGQVVSHVLSWEGDRWLNWPCGCTGAQCREAGPRAAHLPGPVQSVTAVTVNGVVLPESGYRLEGDVLYRVGGNWPVQDMNRPAGEAGTWTVDYQRGLPVPAGVDRLTGVLAGEFISACTGETCRLPSNVTQVSRQGVSYSVYNPNDIYNHGKTGLPEVDMWLAAVNPRHLIEAPSVI